MKKYLSVLLAVLLVFALISCSDSSSSLEKKLAETQRQLEEAKIELYHDKVYSTESDIDPDFKVTVETTNDNGKFVVKLSKNSTSVTDLLVAPATVSKSVNALPIGRFYKLDEGTSITVEYDSSYSGYVYTFKSTSNVAWDYDNNQYILTKEEGSVEIKGIGDLYVVGYNQNTTSTTDAVTRIVSVPMGDICNAYNDRKVLAEKLNGDAFPLEFVPADNTCSSYKLKDDYASNSDLIKIKYADSLVSNTNFKAEEDAKSVEIFVLGTSATTSDCNWTIGDIKTNTIGQVAAPSIDANIVSKYSKSVKNLYAGTETTATDYYTFTITSGSNLMCAVNNVFYKESMSFDATYATNTNFYVYKKEVNKLNSIVTTKTVGSDTVYVKTSWQPSVVEDENGTTTNKKAIYDDCYNEFVVQVVNKGQIDSSVKNVDLSLKFKGDYINKDYIYYRYQGSNGWIHYVDGQSNLVPTTCSDWVVFSVWTNSLIEKFVSDTLYVNVKYGTDKKNCVVAENEFDIKESDTKLSLDFGNNPKNVIENNSFKVKVDKAGTGFYQKNGVEMLVTAVVKATDKRIYSLKKDINSFGLTAEGYEFKFENFVTNTDVKEGDDIDLYVGINSENEHFNNVYGPYKYISGDFNKEPSITYLSCTDANVLHNGDEIFIKISDTDSYKKVIGKSAKFGIKFTSPQSNIETVDYSNISFKLVHNGYYTDYDSVEKLDEGIYSFFITGIEQDISDKLTATITVKSGDVTLTTTTDYTSGADYMAPVLKTSYSDNSVLKNGSIITVQVEDTGKVMYDYSATFGIKFYKDEIEYSKLLKDIKFRMIEEGKDSADCDGDYTITPLEGLSSKEYKFEVYGIKETLSNVRATISVTANNITLSTTTDYTSGTSYTAPELTIVTSSSDSKVLKNGDFIKVSVVDVENQMYGFKPTFKITFWEEKVAKSSYKKNIKYRMVESGKQPAECDASGVVTPNCKLTSGTEYVFEVYGIKEQLPNVGAHVEVTANDVKAEGVYTYTSGTDPEIPELPSFSVYYNGDHELTSGTDLYNGSKITLDFGQSNGQAEVLFNFVDAGNHQVKGYILTNEDGDDAPIDVDLSPIYNTKKVCTLSGITEDATNVTMTIAISSMGKTTKTDFEGLNFHLTSVTDGAYVYGDLSNLTKAVAGSTYKISGDATLVSNTNITSTDVTLDLSSNNVTVDAKEITASDFAVKDGTLTFTTETTFTAGSGKWITFDNVEFKALTTPTTITFVGKVKLSNVKANGVNIEALSGELEIVSSTLNVLTATDVEVKAESSNVESIATSNGKLNIYGTSYTSLATSNTDVTLANATFGEVASKAGKLTIESGTFNGTVKTSGTDVTVNGGTFSTETDFQGGKFVINDGSFNEVVKFANSSKSNEINGGTFDKGITIKKTNTDFNVKVTKGTFKSFTSETVFDGETVTTPTELIFLQGGSYNITNINDYNFLTKCVEATNYKVEATYNENKYYTVVLKNN